MWGEVLYPQAAFFCTFEVSDPALQAGICSVYNDWMAATFGPMAKEMCSRHEMAKTATGLVVDSTCKIGNMTSVSHTEFNGDFNSAYTVTTTSKNSGGPAGMPAETMLTIDTMPGGVGVNSKPKRVP